MKTGIFLLKAWVIKCKFLNHHTHDTEAYQMDWQIIHRDIFAFVNFREVDGTDNYGPAIHGSVLASNEIVR